MKNWVQRINQFIAQHRIIAPLAVIAVMAVGSYSLVVHAGTTTATAITINGTAAGPTFGGVGAIAGGGGNPRYLIDYPEPQRSQVLDYLFKPDYGANLEMLKLEIGGDTQTTDGAEASIEHTKGQINCGSGYEWWLAEQAVQRNPNIKIYGLQWGAPGWVDDGGQTLWTQDDVNYVIDWMNCAKSHNIPVAYVGGWNERDWAGNPTGYNASWYENLRTALNNNGYSSTQIVAADQSTGGTSSGPWGVADALVSNSTFKNAVSILGVHDTCPGVPTTGYTCTTTSNARSLGKPMWQSEEGGMQAMQGSADMVRAVLNGYIQATQTGFLEWPVMDSMPQELPLEDRGLVTADQPWSGNYTVNRMLWAIGQITQFVPAGWNYVGGANKVIGDSGSYNTFQAPDHSAWSMIAQNTSSSSTQTVTPQTINVTISGGLPSSTVHVWETNLWSAATDTGSWMVQEPDVHPTNGTFSYTIPAGYVVSFTTTTGQGKGDAGTPPAAQGLSLPYSNALDTDDGSDEPADFSPQEGSFQMAPCQGGVSGNCTQQMTSAQPLFWENDNNASMYPYAIVGDDSWSNYTVSSKVLFTQSNGSGGVIGRFTNRYGNSDAFDGYIFQVTEGGQWKIIKNYEALNPTPTVLASGTVSSLGITTWHTLALTMNGSQLTGSIDGTPVGTANDTSYTYGLAGIQAGAFTKTWPVNQYQDFNVTADTDTPADPAVTITSGLAGKCLDNNGGVSTDNNKVDIWSCNSTPAQEWTLAGDSTIQTDGKCLTVYQAGTANNSKVNLYTCTGGANQIWQIKGNTLVNPVSGKCLDDPGASTTNGTQLDIYTCVSGAKNEQWNT